MRTFEEIGQEHLQVLQAALATLGPAVRAVTARCAEALASGRALLICGNGGSAADAQHFACELAGRYEADRPALRAVALTCDTSLLTAVANDLGFDRVFARQVEALGQPGDVLLAISTSGASPSVLQAARTARARGLAVIALTGETGGALAPLADLRVAVPSRRTARIQEVHALVLHALAEALEAGILDRAGPNPSGLS
jgi:D-sedoheptulose 7-phosphate isomerase